jgi:peptidoglycan glycosyltransferase
VTLGFALLVGATSYWGFLRAEDLADRPDNLRRVVFDRTIQRGRILDRAGRPLAETRFGPDGEPERAYPVPAAAPVVGFQTWRYGAGALESATYGAGGAEAAYDIALRGDLGQSAREMLAARVLHRPQVGRDVVLTLDGELQALAADELAGREGAVVVLDVADGAVRALVSQPTYDPGRLDEIESLADDPSRPLLNRATQGLYPPGSTWKTVTLAAALDAGITTADVVVDDGNAIEYFEGFPVRCNNNPEGVLRFDIVHAFGWSCNVTFARLGVALGAERYRAYARAFGVNTPGRPGPALAPPFPLPVAPSSLSADDEIGLPELASAAYGQGEILVTPLEMALVAAAVAGDGSLPVPYLLADVPALGGRWTSIADERGTWLPGVPSGTAAAMRQVMAVSGAEGWARTASQAAGRPVAGKTGTAQLASGEPHAWFIGFAPPEAPRLAVAVLVVRGGEGSTVAAPIGGRVLARGLAAEES